MTTLESILAGSLCVAIGLIIGLALRLRQWKRLALIERERSLEWEGAVEYWQKDVERWNSKGMPKPKKPAFKIEVGK